MRGFIFRNKFTLKNIVQCGGVICLNKSIFQFFSKFELDKLVLLVCILVYLIIGILLVQNYLYIVYTDTISYIHVAQLYINGCFSYAINGYWSPLFSWLLIPFLMVWPGKLGALFSIKILNLMVVSPFLAFTY